MEFGRAKNCCSSKLALIPWKECLFDANPIGFNTMGIAFALLLDVFGLPPNRDRFDKATLWSVFIDRKFPHWYHYPNPHNVTEPHSLDCDTNGVCNYTAEALKDRPS